MFWKSVSTTKNAKKNSSKKILKRNSIFLTEDRRETAKISQKTPKNMR